MSPPLPVPSKAAIHALRGIALGTSCAIGVILEDRRRRINTLATAVSNKKKLKSARQYHGTFDIFATQFEDQPVLVGTDVHWHSTPDTVKDQWEQPSSVPPSSKTDQNPPREPQEPEAASGSESASKPSSSHPVAQTQPSSPPTAQRPVPTPASSWRPPKSLRSNITVPQSSSAISFQPAATPPELSAKKLAEFVEEINNILASNDDGRLDQATAKFLEVTRTYYASRPFDDEWLEVSSRLSRDNQAYGKWEDATTILTAAVKAGQLDESRFYAHNPLGIIQFLLRPKDADISCSKEAAAAASTLFMAPFKEKPQIWVAELEDVAKQLITELLLLEERPIVHSIFWRLLGLLKDPAPFTGWVIRTLSEHQDHKHVVKYFLLNFSKMDPDVTSYNTTIDCVVHSVEELQGLKVNLVLRAFARMDSPRNKFLRTRWIMRLLQAHWHRNENFAESQALFEEVMSLGLLSKVKHPEGIYRTMVEIAINANEVATANLIYEKIIQNYPDMITDVPLKGFLTLAKAKAGDWGGVIEDFEEMCQYRQGQQKAYDDAFIMVLKVFTEDHPVADVREFVTRFQEDLGVRMHHYIVTLVANKYGDCHDMEGFVSWLEHCSKAGFALNSGFCNTSLHNCRTKWGVSFPELQELYSKMKELKPDFDDDVTRRIMSQAALAAGTRFRSSPKGIGVRSRVVPVDNRAYTGESANTRDVYEAMNHELSNGKTAAVVATYKRAMSFGMPFCRHCLRLAVTAALQGSRNARDGPGTAMMLIHNAHQQGHDVSPAVATYIKFQVEHFRAGRREVYMHMRNLITQFEALQVVIKPDVLTHIAIVCIKLGQHGRAIALCQLAKQRRGSDNLCFSRQSVRALLMAYSQKWDLAGMKKLMSDLLASEYAADKTVLSYMTSTRRNVQKYRRDPKVIALQEVLEDGINAVRQCRLKTRMEGKTISEETLRIFGNAVADMQDGSGSVEALLQDENDPDDESCEDSPGPRSPPHTHPFRTAAVGA
ncbi:hypothetical protein F5B20DRAFT_561660 [Whalleya microplaca]|nr:hypothetical protein F5B20DRAFT_561660 [Whalleya microplaca]